MDETTGKHERPDYVQVLDGAFSSGTCQAPRKRGISPPKASKEPSLDLFHVRDPAHGCATMREENNAHPNARAATRSSAPHIAERGCFGVTCEECKQPYFVTRVRHDRGRRLCASCRGKAGQAKAQSHFVCPDSEEAERIRAQGLVNKRLRLKWFDKPTTCCKCGNPHRRMIGHHQNYKKPDQVHWVCPGCHRRVHLDSRYLDGIPPFICDRKNPAPPRHSKGGWFGPRPSKGRCPFITIRDVVVADGQVTEILACGHTFTRSDDGKRPVQRRCKACRDARLSPSPAALEVSR